MYVHNSLIGSKFDGKSTYTTFFLWCSDGWMYETTSRKRRRFTPVSEGVFNMEEEHYSKCTFSDVEYQEQIKITVISESPRVWIETGHNFSQKFEVLDGAST